jgi:hypothetical protein
VKSSIVIPSAAARVLREHLFQNEVEQGAFLFARQDAAAVGLRLVVEHLYLVPPLGWEVQMEVYLEMRDSERAKIMKLARDKNLAAIDCHSHPQAGERVRFSPSDVAGITEFAQYARWKLDGKPFAAIVCGEESVDAVVWHGTFSQAEPVHEIRVSGNPPRVLVPNGSWFRDPRGRHRFAAYE